MTLVLVLDTSFLVSFFLQADENHLKAVEIFEAHRTDEMMITDTILFETLSVLNKKGGMALAKEAYEKLASNSKMLFVYIDEEERKETVSDFLSQKGRLSVADVSVVRACKRTLSRALCFDKAVLKEI